MQLIAAANEILCCDTSRQQQRIPNDPRPAGPISLLSRLDMSATREQALNRTFHENVCVSKSKASCYSAPRQIRNIRRRVIGLFYSFFLHQQFYISSRLLSSLVSRYCLYRPPSLFSLHVRLFLNGWTQGHTSPLFWDFDFVAKSPDFRMHRVSFHPAVLVFCCRNNTDAAHLGRQLTNDDDSRKRLLSALKRQPVLVSVEAQHSPVVDCAFDMPQLACAGDLSAFIVSVAVTSVHCSRNIYRLISYSVLALRPDGRTDRLNT